MRRNILTHELFSAYSFVIILFFISLNLFAQEYQILSLRAYSSNDETSFPIILANDPSKNSITIDFDVQSRTLPNFNIIFRFCDSDWIPYESAFLVNQGYNTEYNLYFERLPSTVKGASFHFKGSFPNQNVTFPFSGKWRYFIVDSQDKRLVYGSGNFFVVNPIVKLNTNVFREGLDGDNPEHSSLRRTIGIRTSFALPDSLFQSQIKSVEFIENRKIFDRIVADRFTTTPEKYYEWNGSNKFSFIARQLKPGNEYRETDFRNTSRFNQPSFNAQYDGVETSNFFRRNRRDLNGSFILSDYRDIHADYYLVNFKIRPPENILDPVFLVGSFTNWKVLPEYEMFDDNGLLNLSVPLKRGIYNYQFVTGSVVNGEVKNIDWNILEGNFWETTNEYFIFLYYQTTDKGGYDQIIGFSKINSGVL